VHGHGACSVFGAVLQIWLHISDLAPDDIEPENVVLG
jgi:hypothetical protein